MRYYIATVLYATIFATMCISSEVFGSKVHCFSCFGYDEDGQTKCRSREEGWLAFVIKCPLGSTDETPVCIQFTASYTVTQWMEGKLEEVPSKAHGLYCGKRQKNTTQCNQKQCPNHGWFPDDQVKNCDVSCCEGSDKDCKFPLPTQYEIDHAYPGEIANMDGQAVAGRRSGMSSRISWSVWLQAVSFAIFGWFKFRSP